MIYRPLIVCVLFLLSCDPEPEDPVMGLWETANDPSNAPYGVALFFAEGRLGWADINQQVLVFEKESDWFWSAARDTLFIDFDTLPGVNAYSKILEQPNEFRFFDFTNDEKLVLTR